MKIALLLNSILLSVSALAQPILTSTGCAFLVGEPSNNLITSTAVSPGNSGANQTWNLTFGTTTAYDYNLVAPSSTPYGSSYPTSNVATVNSGAYGYYLINSNKMSVLGIVSPSGVEINYSNPDELMHFPFTYNDTYTDAWACQFTSGGYMFYRTGSTVVTADSYGTLTTPTGTYHNVLRVHWVQNYVDSADIGGFPYIIVYNNDEYVWYVNGIHSPIATTVSLVTNGVLSSYATYSTATVGLEEIQTASKVNVFPNPVQDKLYITIPENTSQGVLSLYDVLGKEVMISPILNINGKHEIDVSQLNNGTYTLFIRSQEKLYKSDKLVIAK